MMLTHVPLPLLNKSLWLWFEISINTDVSVLKFYGYIGDIGGYFDKNIGETKIIQNSWKYLEKVQKMMK